MKQRINNRISYEVVGENPNNIVKEDVFILKGEKDAFVFSYSKDIETNQYIAYLMENSIGILDYDMTEAGKKLKDLYIKNNCCVLRLIKD